MIPWWAILILVIVAIYFGFQFGRRRRKSTIDGMIFWDERGINIKLGLSIQELALDRDYVILKVLPNNEVKDEIREISDGSNRTE